MNFRHIAILLAVALLPGAFAQAPAPSKAEIEQIVRDYIMQHPEVLIDSIRQMQERERVSKVQKSKGALTARHSDLVSDPTSPASRPASEKTVNIVEFFDYHCGFCKRVMPALSKVLAANPDVRIVYKEFPILGAESVVGAKAALAAARQGGYLKFHDALMNLNAPITMANLEKLAQEQGLDLTKLKADMESPEVSAIIAKNAELAAAVGVEATPTFVIGKELIAGAVDASAFQKYIDQAKTPATEAH